MKQHHAFSLVELSIVLVILGLLVGGILAGQSLIRASELRAVSTEFHRYSTAFNAFRDKYFVLPGDMANATSFWGTAANCPGTSAQGSTTQATCNGNGNNIIYPSTNSIEHFRAWQHLANAGLIEGNYSGVSGPDDSTSDSLLGINVPQSKLSSAGWSIRHNVSGIDVFTPSGIHIFSFGGDAADGTQTSKPTTLTPEEAWNIDTKLDDGFPPLGKVMAFRTGCTNGSSTSDLNATYVLSTKTKVCSLYFIRPF